MNKLTSAYPLQFYSHLWVENGIVVDRAIEIWPRMVEIDRFWKGLSKSNHPGKSVPGANTSFDHLKKAIDGPLIHVKVAFFSGNCFKIKFILTGLSD